MQSDFCGSHGSCSEVALFHLVVSGNINQLVLA